MGKLLPSPITWSATYPLQSTMSRSWTRANLCCPPWKIIQQLSKDQFRETRKYLESIYVQQPNQPQTNNVKEGGEESEAMHVHEDYQNHPYQSPTLMADLRQQTKDDSALMAWKGVYPYEYMESFVRFQELKSPHKDVFYSSLTEEDISETKYTNTKSVKPLWHERTQRLSIFILSINLYLLTDVLLLADVFENFRDVCLQHYGLNHAHNYTSLGLSWQAPLKIIDVELDLLTMHYHKVALGTGIAPTPTSIVFYCCINYHGWKTISPSALVNVQLQKMALKKISLSW